MLTPLGKALRKLRIDRGLRLLDMAKDLGISAAYLSSIEMGRKRVPDDLVKKIVRRYELDRATERQLEADAAMSIRSLEIDLKGSGDKTRELALYLSRKFEAIGDIEAERALESLRSALEKGSGGR